MVKLIENIHIFFSYCRESLKKKKMQNYTKKKKIL